MKNQFFNSFKDIVNLKRFNKNLLSLSFNLFSKIIVHIAYIPLMFLSWGVTLTGVWFFLQSIPGILSIINFDPGNYTRQKFISSKFNNFSKIYTNSYIILFANIIFLFFPYLIILIFLEKFEVLKSTDTNYYIIIILIYFSNIFEIISNFSLLKKEAQGEIHIRNNLQSFFFIFTRISILLVGFYSSELLYLSITILIISFVRYSLILFLNRNILSIRFNINFINKKTVLLQFRQSIQYLFLNSQFIIEIYAINFFLGIFFSADKLAMINSLIILFKLLPNQINNIFITSLNIEYAKLYSQNNFKKIFKLERIYNSGFIFFSILSLIITIFFGEYVYNLWTKNNFSGYQIFMYIILLGGLIDIFSYNKLSIYAATVKFNNEPLKLFIISIFFLIIGFFSLKLNLNLNLFFLIILIKNMTIYFYAYSYSLNLKKKLNKKN
jgi:hypothetical protein